MNSDRAVSLTSQAQICNAISSQSQVSWNRSGSLATQEGSIKRRGDAPAYVHHHLRNEVEDGDCDCAHQQQHPVANISFLASTQERRHSALIFTTRRGIHPWGSSSLVKDSRVVVVSIHIFIRKTHY